MVDSNDDNLFPLFGVKADRAAVIAGVAPSILRSWLRAGDLGADGGCNQDSGDCTSHQVLRAAALAHFKNQKRSPNPALVAHHPLLATPFVILLTKERVPVMLEVDALPAYLARPSTVVVFDARPIQAKLRAYHGSPPVEPVT